MDGKGAASVGRAVGIREQKTLWSFCCPACYLVCLSAFISLECAIPVIESAERGSYPCQTSCTLCYSSPHILNILHLSAVGNTLKAAPAAHGKCS